MSPPDHPDHDHHAPPAEFSLVGMLLKLIFLPGLVVLVIVMVGLTIAWLTLPHGDMDSLIDAVAQDDSARWPAAVNLAAVLQEPGNMAVKRDPAAARRLIEILHKELAAGAMDQEQIHLRMYLCRALGEFHIAQPLPVLLAAARTERDPREVDVRRSAIEAIAVLASHAEPAELHAEDQLIPVLVEAAEDARPPVRCAAAFALGVVGGGRAEIRLETMLADSSSEVRYNAATGLARHGNSKCIGTLVEMLDPGQPASRGGFRRATILRNALQATSRLAAEDPNADLAELVRAVQRLRRAAVGAQVRVKATEVLNELKRHG